MTVLVTGGSGFIGSSLISRLVAEGISVRGLHRTAAPPPIRGTEWRQVTDIGSEPCNEAMFRGCDTVVHLAALAHQQGRAARDQSERFFRTNVDGTRSIMDACRRAGVRRLLFLSSVAAVCSESLEPVDEETSCAPDSDYGRSKLEAEHVIREGLRGCGVDWCILRPPLAYGPRNPGNMARLMRLMGLGIPLPFGSVANIRSFIFVGNLVDAMVRVVRERDPIRSTFMVSDGSDFSTPALIAALASPGETVNLFRVPVGLLRMIAHAGDVTEKVIGTSGGINTYSIDRLLGSLPVNGRRFRERFGWHPPVDCYEGLRLTREAAHHGLRER